MTERVLIIDDEENIRQMIRLTLETAGYEVGEAKDGMEAFAVLGSDSSWDVVLLDQRMPEMQGTDVLRRLKVLVPSAAVIMMTAFASVELAVEAMKLGATDFLRKPMTPEIVRNAVSAVRAKVTKPHVEEIGDEYKQSRARMVTMNGFTLLRASDVKGALPQKPNERRFLVRRPNGSEREVVVEISDEAIEPATQFAGGEPIERSFWTTQAETFLSDFIWTDGNLPGTGRLILKAIEREQLEKLRQPEKQK